MKKVTIALALIVLAMIPMSYVIGRGMGGGHGRHGDNRHGHRGHRGGHGGRHWNGTAWVLPAVAAGTVAAVAASSGNKADQPRAHKDLYPSDEPPAYEDIYP